MRAFLISIIAGSVLAYRHKAFEAGIASDGSVQKNHHELSNSSELLPSQPSEIDAQHKIVLTQEFMKQKVVQAHRLARKIIVWLKGFLAKVLSFGSGASGSAASDLFAILKELVYTGRVRSNRTQVERTGIFCWICIRRMTHLEVKALPRSSTSFAVADHVRKFGGDSCHPSWDHQQMKTVLEASYEIDGRSLRLPGVLFELIANIKELLTRCSAWKRAMQFRGKIPREWFLISEGHECDGTWTCETDKGCIDERGGRNQALAACAQKCEEYKWFIYGIGGYRCVPGQNRCQCETCNECNPRGHNDYHLYEFDDEDTTRTKMRWQTARDALQEHSKGIREATMATFKYLMAYASLMEHRGNGGPNSPSIQDYLAYFKTDMPNSRCSPKKSLFDLRRYIKEESKKFCLIVQAMFMDRDGMKGQVERAQQLDMKARLQEALQSLGVKSASNDSFYDNC